MSDAFPKKEESIRHESVPEPPFTISVTFNLQKDCKIPGEFPYQTLSRTVQLTYTEEQITHPFFLMQPIEKLIRYGLELNGVVAFDGLGMENGYDRIVVESWNLVSE